MWKSFALCGHCFVDDSVFAGKVEVTEASYIVRADGQRAIFGTHTTFRLCRYSLEAAIIPCSPWTFRITITDIDCLPCWVQSRFQQTVVEKHPARRRELLRVASCVTPAIPFSANGQGIGIFGDFRHKTGKMWISEHILPVMGVLRQPDFLCWFEPGFDLSFLDPKAPPDVSGPPRDAEVLSSTDAWCAKLLIRNTPSKTPPIRPWKIHHSSLPKVDWHPRCSSDPLVHCPSPFHWRAQVWKHGNELGLVEGEIAYRIDDATWLSDDRTTWESHP